MSRPGLRQPKAVDLPSAPGFLCDALDWTHDGEYWVAKRTRSQYYMGNVWSAFVDAVNAQATLVNALSTGVVAVFTVGLFVATGLLWVATRKLVIGADQSSQRQLRAYVAVWGGGIRPMRFTDTGTDGLMAHVEVKNFGQTPGYDFRTWMRAELGVADPDRAFIVPDHLDDTPHSILGPTASAHISRGVAVVAQEQIASLRQGALQVFVWGKVEYRDAFGRARYFIFRSVSSGQTVDGGWALGPHRRGYDAN